VAVGRIEDLGGVGHTFDAILLSEVLHLCDSVPAAVDALRSAIAAEGVVGVRVGTREQVAARDWYFWYPKARAIDISRSPTRDELVAAFENGGFDVALSFMDESRWLPITTFQDMMLHRAFSSFRLIGETEHAEQSELMLKDTSSMGDVWFSYEMSWLIATPR
jgi:hypothetical protein